MIYLVTGMPGNGKTLYAVDFIKKAVDKGRAVYSDIKGLTLPGVQPAPADWRTLPDGALVVYDEAHKRFPSYKGKGRSPLEVVRDMDEHRHRGFDMMFITQWPDKIDQELFRLVGTHWHLNRAFGLQSASLAAFTRGVMNPYSATARKGADESVWSYPTDLYKVYKSSSMHTDAHKFKLPAKLKAALMSLPVILLALWGFYWFITPKAPEKKPAAAERSVAETPPMSATLMGNSGAQASGQPDKAPATGEYFSLTGPTVTPIVGCVDSHRGCRCWNQDGLLIDQTQAECRRVVERPLPINIYHQYSSPSGSAPVAGAVGGGQTLGGPGARSEGVVQGAIVERKTRALGTFPESPSKVTDTYTPATTLEM